jgi:hypothetical protein
MHREVPYQIKVTSIMGVLTSPPRFAPMKAKIPAFSPLHLGIVIVRISRAIRASTGISLDTAIRMEIIRMEIIRTRITIKIIMIMDSTSIIMNTIIIRPPNAISFDNNM